MPQENEKKEPLEINESIKFTDFLSGVKIPDEPVAETPVEGAKTETKPEEKVAKFPEEVVEAKEELHEEKEEEEAREPLPGQEVETPAVTAKKEKAARDYTGIEEQHKPLFEKMGNEAFAFAKQNYIESKQLRQQVEEVRKNTKAPVSVYGHQRAYVLDEKYQELIGGVNLATQITNHWTAQAAKIRRGEPFQDADVDPKTGRLVNIGAPRQATAEDEVNVANWLDTAKEQKAGVLNAYQKFVEGYEQHYNNDMEKYSAQMNEFFPYHNDPKMKQMQDEIISKHIAKSFQSHPLAKTVACLVYELAKMQTKVAAVNKQTVRADKIKEQTNAPTKQALGAAAGASSANGLPKFSDFKNRMAEA
jgi:hypothetical protein